jgi:hypothetical protein
MLHTETVEPATLDLIRKLQADPELKGFQMAGGTALSLMIGHRISIDIDLFSQKEFDAEALSVHLDKNYGFSLQFIHRNTLKGFIGNVFVDILTHPYPFVGELIHEDEITLISRQDIAAMKVNAIAGNGTRAKDFVDIYFLLKEFTMKDIIGFYGEKYAQHNTFHALKSLTFFSDIDTAIWPKMATGQKVTLKEVQKAISSAQKQYLTDYPTPEDE